MYSAASHSRFVLWLFNIPHSGHISPEVMVTFFSVLSGLEGLCLEFESPQSHPGWESQSLPPPKRSILPALKEFYFQGVTEYLEELVTHIDTPRLDKMNIIFFNQSILTAHDSPNSSMIHQHRGHSIKHIFNLMIGPPPFYFDTRDFRLTPNFFIYQSHAENGSF